MQGGVGVGVGVCDGRMGSTQTLEVMGRQVRFPFQLRPRILVKIEMKFSGSKRQRAVSFGKPCDACLRGLKRPRERPRWRKVICRPSFRVLVAVKGVPWRMQGLCTALDTARGFAVCFFEHLLLQQCLPAPALVDQSLVSFPPPGSMRTRRATVHRALAD